MGAEFIPARVVAFKSSGDPISVKADSWNAELQGRKRRLKLNRWTDNLVYDLERDVVAFILGGEHQETAVGKTIGRMVLSGIAAGTLVSGKAMGGALLDLALRGADTRTVAGGALCMRDGTLVAFRGTQEDCNFLATMCPAKARSTEAVNRAREFEHLLERLIEDGGRALPELDARIAQLAAQLDDALRHQESGRNFEERDTARRDAERIAWDIQTQMALKRALCFQLGTPLLPRDDVLRMGYSNTLETGIPTLFKATEQPTLFTAIFRKIPTAAKEVQPTAPTVTREQPMSFVAPAPEPVSARNVAEPVRATVAPAIQQNPAKSRETETLTPAANRSSAKIMAVSIAVAVVAAGVTSLLVLKFVDRPQQAATALPMVAVPQAAPKPASRPATTGVQSPKIDTAPQTSAPSAEAVPSSPSASSEPLPAARASTCVDAEACITAMLQSAALESQVAAEEAAQRIDALPQPLRGDRKTARNLNKEALAALNRQKWDDAIALLRKAREADPADEEIVSNLAFAYGKAELFNQAEKVAMLALAINPRRTSAWAPLAATLAKLNRPKDALYAMWLAYQYSSNKEKTIAVINSKIEEENDPQLKAMYESSRAWFVENRRPE